MIKFCPECGEKREEDKCKCGYNFISGEVENQKKLEERISSENPVLFKENSLDKDDLDYQKIYFDNQLIPPQPLTFIEQYKKMNPNSNLTEEEILELYKSVHFTA
jgi:hypothetical protein